MKPLGLGKQGREASPWFSVPQSLNCERKVLDNMTPRAPSQPETLDLLGPTLPPISAPKGRYICGPGTQSVSRQLGPAAPSLVTPPQPGRAPPHLHVLLPQAQSWPLKFLDAAGDIGGSSLTPHFSSTSGPPGPLVGRGRVHEEQGGRQQPPMPPAAAG